MSIDLISLGSVLFGLETACALGLFVITSGGAALGVAASALVLAGALFGPLGAAAVFLTGAEGLGLLGVLGLSIKI